MADAGTFHFICGTDDFAVKEAVSALMRELCGAVPEEDPDLELIRGDSDTEEVKETLDRFIGTLTTPPFLSDRKVIWLKHLDFEKAQAEPSDKKRKSRLEYIAGLIENGIIPGITVIVDGIGCDRKKSWFKSLKASGEKEHCTFQWHEKSDSKGKASESAMIAAANEFASAYGKSLDEDAAVFLAKVTAGDMPRLKNEVLKLVNYAGDAPSITLSDCRQVCPETEETLTWEFTSALAARDTARAIGLIPGIIRTLSQNSASGNPELAAVSAAANEFKRILSLKCDGERYNIPLRASPKFFEQLFGEQLANGIRNPLFTMHPYRVFKMWENASRYGNEEFSRIFDALFQANRAMVTGAGDSRLILESMVLKITTKTNG